MPKTLPQDWQGGARSVMSFLLDRQAQYAAIRTEIREAIDGVCEGVTIHCDSVSPSARSEVYINYDS